VGVFIWLTIWAKEKIERRKKSKREMEEIINGILKQRNKRAQRE
jgi:hypothetical protein